MMKCSELITELSRAITEHGDLEVMAYHERWMKYCLVRDAVVSRVDVSSCDEQQYQQIVEIET